LNEGNSCFKATRSDGTLIEMDGIDP